MTVGFFTAFRTDPQHYLHAVSLVQDVTRAMPGTTVVQFTDPSSPIVLGVSRVERVEAGELLACRIAAYARATPGDWLLLDTDVSLAADVSSVFHDLRFDVALTDRHWPHLPQGDSVMHTMPFNTGVVFSRCAAFWRDVLETWRAFDDSGRADWMSEQRAVYMVVRTGRYRVKILPGMIYNCPPKAQDDMPTEAKILHYKGPKRKAWLTQRYYESCRTQAVLV